ncbi:MAG: hypothetical protein AABW73_04795 [Nanoarchaeota archaeon]
MRKTSRNTKEAFLWIVGILKNNDVPFRISGGLAARLYGTKRKLADIDLEIKKKDFNKILAEIIIYAKSKPKYYRDKNWNVYGMTLNYKNQLIDVSARDDVKLFDYQKKKWFMPKDKIPDKKMRIYGLVVPVQNREELIDYKTRLGRKVDRIEV